MEQARLLYCMTLAYKSLVTVKIAKKEKKKEIENKIIKCKQNHNLCLVKITISNSEKNSNLNRDSKTGASDF